MWQLRDELLAAHGPVEGENRIRSLAYVALQLSPPEPSYVDYRNALLQADRVLRQGADAERIWRVFGERGMGWYASTADSDDADPVASDTPGPGGITGQGTVSGIVTDRDSGAPLAGATVADRRPRAAARLVRDRDRWRRPLPLHQRPGRHVPPPLRARAPATRRRSTATSRCRARRASTCASGATGPTPTRARSIAGTDGAALQRLPRPAARRRQPLDELGLQARRRPRQLLGRHRSSRPPVRATSFAVDPTPHPHAETEMDPRDRCELGAGARPTRVRIEVASEAGGPWKPAVNRAGRRHARLPADRAAAGRAARRRPLRARAPGPPGRRSCAHARLLRGAGLRGRQAPAARRVRVRPQAARRRRRPRASTQPTARPATSPIAALRVGPRRRRHVRDRHRQHAASPARPTARPAATSVGLRVTDADGEQDEFRALVLVARDYEIFDLGTLAPDDSGAAHAAPDQPARRRRDHHGPLRRDRPAARPATGAARCGRSTCCPNHVMGTVWEVNDADQTVGSSYPARQFRKVDGVLWNGSTPTPVGTLGGSSSTAVGLNAIGWVVGWAYDSGERAARLPQAPRQPDGRRSGGGRRAGRPAQDHEAGEDQRLRRGRRLLGLHALGRGLRPRRPLRRRDPHADDAARLRLRRRRHRHLGRRPHGHRRDLRLRPGRPRRDLARRRAAAGRPARRPLDGDVRQRPGHARRPPRPAPRLRRLDQARGRGHDHARLARARQRLAPPGGVRASTTATRSWARASSTAGRAATSSTSAPAASASPTSSGARCRTAAAGHRRRRHRRRQPRHACACRSPTTTTSRTCSRSRRATRRARSRSTTRRPSRSTPARTSGSSSSGTPTASPGRTASPTPTTSCACARSSATRSTAAAPRC